MRHTSIDPEEVARLHALKLRDGEIAALLHCSTQGVQVVRKKLGLPGYGCRPRVQPKKWQDLVHDGLSVEEIARLTGENYATVYARLRRLGLHATGRRKPRAQPAIELSRAAMRVLAANEWAPKDISTVFRKSLSYVYHILKDTP